MSVTAGHRSTPTLSDARRAAEVLVAEGATKVILFGSVARGEAMPDSDMDFLAVMDDLGDYAERVDVAERMSDALEKVGLRHPYDVLVTDRPELGHLVANVETSFYAAAVAYGKELVDVGPQEPINWEKELVVARNRTEEAETSVKEAVKQLKILGNTARGAWEDEIDAWESGDTAKYKKEREDRITELLGCGHLCFEMSLSALIHLLAESPPAAMHTTKTLAEKLPDSVGQDVAEIMGSLEHKDIQFWHVSRNYTRAKIPSSVPPPSEELAVRVTTVACATLAYVVDVLEQHGGDTGLIKEAREISRRETERLQTKGVGEDLSDVPPPQSKSVIPAKRSFWARLFSR